MLCLCVRQQSKVTSLPLEMTAVQPILMFLNTAILQGDMGSSDSILNDTALAQLPIFEQPVDLIMVG